MKDYGVMGEVVIELPVEVEVAAVGVEEVEASIIECSVDLSIFREKVIVPIGH